MRFSNYQTRAALGITRTGTTDGRTISLAHYGVIGAGDDPKVGYHESNVTGGTQCPKDSSGKAPYSRYCACMYGEKDRISQPTPDRQGGAWNFALGSPRHACQTAAELNFAPWSCEGVILTLVGSAGKADPLRHLNGTLTTGPKGAEYKRCAEQTAEKLKQFVPGIRTTLQTMGLIAPDSVPGTGGGSTPITDPTAYKNRLMAMTDSELVAVPQDPYVIEEIGYRRANSCGAGRARQMAWSYAADGRPACKLSRIDYIGGGGLPSLPPGIIAPPGALPPVITPDKKDKDAAEGMPTGLLLGGAAVAVAAFFLLKK